MRWLNDASQHQILGVEMTISLTNLLGQIEGGTAAEHFEEQIRRVITGILETGRSGRVDVSLKIKPIKTEVSPSVSVAFEVRAYLPKGATSGSPFFITKDKLISRVMEPPQLSMID